MPVPFDLALTFVNGIKTWLNSGDQQVHSLDKSKWRTGTCDSVTGDLYTLLGEKAMFYESHNFPINSSGNFGACDDTGICSLYVTTESGKFSIYHTISQVSGTVITTGILNLKYSIDNTGNATFASTLPQSQITNLTADLAAKAADSAVVHNTGNETVAGIKTFSSNPVFKFSIRDTFRNLICQWSSNSTLTFTFDEGFLQDASSNAERCTSTGTVTVNIAASGANGLDTGSEASSTWYYIWAIWNGTAVAGLVSTSSTAPTMPSGYTHKALVGAVYNNVSSNFVNFNQVDNKVSCSETQAVNGTATAWTSFSLATIVPRTAKRARFEINGATVSAGNYIAMYISPTTDYFGASILHDNRTGSYTILTNGYCDLQTAQTLHYRNNNSQANTCTVYIIGWEY